MENRYGCVAPPAADNELSLTWTSRPTDAASLPAECRGHACLGYANGRTSDSFARAKPSPEFSGRPLVSNCDQRLHRGGAPKPRPGGRWALLWTMTR